MEKTMSDVEKITSDKIQTTSNLFCYIQQSESHIIITKIICVDILLKFKNVTLETQ